MFDAIFVVFFSFALRAGPSAHNANLAVKSILGIAAYAALCNATGRTCGPSYHSVAQSYAKQWAVLARGGLGGASVRDYNSSGSWSQKYNLIFDKVFNFGLFDTAIDSECAMYMNASLTAVRREYGWYLDDRSATDARHLTNAG